MTGSRRYGALVLAVGMVVTLLVTLVQAAPQEVTLKVQGMV